MKNIVVLVSGSGTNLQRIIDAVENKEIREAQISLVIADRNCYAVERARKHHIKTLEIPRGKNFSSQLDSQIPKHTDLIVLAGFLSILQPEFCKRWNRKIINIHPALLPKFGGKGMWGHHVHEAVVAAGETESGATVHFVTAGIDEGDIILQKSFPVLPNDTAEKIAEKVHLEEYEIFPKAIDLLLNAT